MASPNFSSYIDLTINDKSITEVYDASVQYAQTSLPEFDPRVGTIENALLEAVAHATGSLIATINTLPDGLMEGLLKLMGFSRVEATPSAATVSITLSINTGATILLVLFSLTMFLMLKVFSHNTCTRQLPT